MKSSLKDCTWQVLPTGVCFSLGRCGPVFRGGVGECLWRRQWHPTPVLLPGKSQGRRSLVGYCPWGRTESDTTEGLHFHFSLSCTGEGNGNPLQCSCLENPRDGGAWWAAVSGVTQSQTRLKRLSSSSSRVYTVAECGVKGVEVEVDKYMDRGGFTSL